MKRSSSGKPGRENMKWEYWIITVVLLLLAALGGMADLTTTIDEQQEVIVERELEISRLEKQLEAMKPPPYSEPLQGARISSGCGYRMDPMGGGTEGLHKGVDLVAPIGTPVRAVLAGTVVEHWPAPDGYWNGHPVFGGLVVIDHGDGLFSIYGHLKSTCVHEGWQVGADQVIGELGDTGIATGPHLHFELVVDPLRYLEER
jgi:murein DD-endopeptidase MepM/ murein hydrolase activator NlpD